MPLSEYEMRVLADLEADLRDLDLTMPQPQPPSAARILLVVAPGAAVAIALSDLAVQLFGPVAAAILTGMIGAAISAVIALLLSRLQRRTGR